MKCILNYLHEGIFIKKICMYIDMNRSHSHQLRVYQRYQNPKRIHWLLRIDIGQSPLDLRR